MTRGVLSAVQYDGLLILVVWRGCIRPQRPVEALLVEPALRSLKVQVDEAPTLTERR